MNVSQNTSAFKLAICNGNLTDVERILLSAFENGEAVSLLRAVHGQYKETALHLAVRHGKEEIVNLLLKSPEVDVNATDSHQRTALHVAASEPGAQNNSAGIIQLLLSQRNITVDKEETHGNTPLKLAAEKGNIAAVKMLLGKNADITKADKARNTAVHVAAKKGHFEVLWLLLSCCKNLSIIGQQNKNKDTPLHLAAEKCCKLTVAVLLYYGADITITTENEQKQTPADLAVASQEVLALLRDPKTARKIVFESGIPQMEQIFADSGYQVSEISQVGENSVVSVGCNALVDRSGRLSLPGMSPVQVNMKWEFNTHVLDGGIAAVGPNSLVGLPGSQSGAVNEQALPLAKSSYNVQVSGGAASIGDNSIVNVGAMTPRVRFSVSSSSSGSPSSAGSSSGGDPFTYDRVQMAQQLGSEEEGTTRSIEPRSGSHRAEHDNNPSHVQTSGSSERSISPTAGTPGCVGSSIVSAASLETAHPPGSVSAKGAEFTVNDVSAGTPGHPSAACQLETSSTPKTSNNGISIKYSETSEFKVPLAVNDVSAATSGDPGISRHLGMCGTSKTSYQAAHTKSPENSKYPLPAAVNFTATNPEGTEIKGNGGSSELNTSTSVLTLESSRLNRTTGPIDASPTSECSAGIQAVTRTGSSPLIKASRSPETAGNSRAPFHPQTRTSKGLPAHSGTVKSPIGTANNKTLVGPNCPDGPFGAVGSMETSRPPGSMNSIKNEIYGGTAQEEGSGPTRAIKSHKSTYSGAACCTEMPALGVNDSAPRGGVDRGLTHRVPLTASPGQVSQLHTVYQDLESGAQTSVKRNTIDPYACVDDRNPPNGCSRRSDEPFTSGYSNTSESNIEVFLSKEDFSASGGDLTQPLLGDSSPSISNERAVLSQRVNPSRDGDSTSQSEIDNIVNEDPSRDIKGQKGCSRCCIT